MLVIFWQLETASDATDDKNFRLRLLPVITSLVSQEIRFTVSSNSNFN